MHEMEGATWQPVPGYKGDHALVGNNGYGKKAGREGEDDDPVSYEAIPIEENKARTIRIKSNPNTGISRADVDAYKPWA